MLRKKKIVQIDRRLSAAIMFVGAIVLSLQPQSCNGADAPANGLFVGIGLGSHNASTHYPDFQWIAPALEFDSIGGEQPIRNFNAGEVGLAIAGRLGHKVKIEPSLNIFFGFGGGTKPKMSDTSIYFVSSYQPSSTDTSFHLPADRNFYTRRRYTNEQYVGVNLAADIGARAGIPFTLGSWTLIPMVGLKGNMLWTSASEYFCGSYYWLIVPLGVGVSHEMGKHWRFGGELFADPVIACVANWSFNVFVIVGSEGKFVNLGTPVGFSGCLKFSRSGNRGGLELSPYFTYFHHGQSNAAGSNIRWWFNNSDYGGEGKWFEPKGSTLRIGLKLGWFFAMGRKHNDHEVEIHEVNDEEGQDIDSDDNDNDDNDNDDNDNDDNDK